jgi:hypothetical protein
MGFVNPGLLALLGFLAAPIIIQFFVNRRRIVLPWAAYEWMRQAMQVQRRQVRINDWLKLFAKLLLMLALVLLVARPAWTLSRNPRRLVVIDNSLSMLAEQDGKTRLEAAKGRVGELLRRSDAPTALFSFDGTLTPLARGQVRPGAATAALGDLAASHRAGTARDLVAALAAEPSVNESDSIYLVGDFQRIHWRDEAVFREMAERIGRGRRIVLVPVDPRQQVGNVAVTEVVLPPEGFYPGHENELVVHLRNHGDAEVAALPVTLSVNGQAMDRTLVSLGPQAELEVRLNLHLREAAVCRVEVSIPPDRFAPDNQWFMVIDPGPALRVLAVAPDPPPGSPFPLDVFFRGALRAFCAESYLSYQRARPPEIYEMDVSGYDLIVTFGVPLDRREGIAGKLLAAVERGAGLISFAAPGEAEAWSGMEVPAGSVVTAEASPDPGRLAGTWLAFMSEPGLDPSLIHVFQGRGIGGATTPEAGGRLFLAGHEEAVAAIRPFGAGQAALVGFLPYPGHTDMFYNPNFVQWAMRLTSEVLPRRMVHVQSGDELAAIAWPDADAEASFSLAKADGSERQRLAVVGLGRNAALRAAPPSDGGFLVLHRDDRPLQTLGYNLPREDSAIEPCSAAEFTGAASAGMTISAEPWQEESRTRREYLWATLVLLSLALALEAYAHFFRRLVPVAPATVGTATAIRPPSPTAPEAGS